MMTANKKNLSKFCIYGFLALLLTLLYPHFFNIVVNADEPCSCATLTINKVGNGNVATQGGGEDLELAVQIGPNNSYVLLKNSQISVKYESFFEEHQQFAIREFVIKTAGNQNQVSSQYLDANAGRGPLADVSIVYDGPDRKTVRLEWYKYNSGIDYSHTIIHEVSIFPNSKFLKIDYNDVQHGLNIVDLGQPGGTSAGTHVAYGAAGWVRGYVTSDYAPTVGSYYNRYDPDPDPSDSEVLPDPTDGGSLNYNGHFILGVYNPATNIGFGRVMPITDTHIVKLLLSDSQRRGFEFFPHPFYQAHSPFTGYLFAVTGGESEIISLGQQLADENYGPFESCYVCDDVQLTALPEPGWTFSEWSGDTSGVTNPISLTVDSDLVVTVTFTSDVTSPVIDIWYGTDQKFGHLGTPQQYLNILGNVSDPESDVSSLIYSLNGVPGPVVNGVPGNLMIGPHPASDNRRRLYFEGDFNIDIDKDTPALNEGLNTVVITATNGTGITATETITLEYESGVTWTLPYTVDWDLVTDMQNAVQVVDGLWTWDANGIRTGHMAYDRAVAIGDMTWDDYEVTVPITIHDVDETIYGSTVSVGPGLGVSLRWKGHTDQPAVAACTQPECGWEPTGISSWYEWLETQPDRLTLEALPSTGMVQTTTLQFQTGNTYWFKTRAQTNGGGTLYSFKVWEDGQTEPTGWTLQRQEPYSSDPTDYLETGSLLLVAHHVDITFGDITVMPVEMITTTLTTNTIGSGSITVEPNQSEYALGTTITVTAVAESGWAFTGWSGHLSGTTNPAYLTMDEDKVITATFTEITSHTLTITTVGSGTVTTEPNQVEYLTGAVVTMTAVATPGSVFAGWSGDLFGTTNPITLTMTGDKMVTATFTSGATIVSDDFNSCTLSSMWTHYPGQSGDPAPVLSGTHVLLSVPAGLDHDIWEDGAHASRIMQAVENTNNFTIEVKFDSEVGSSYQTQGILIEQDSNDLLRLEFFGKDSKTHIYVAKIEEGIPSNIGGGGLEIGNPDVAPLYMQVKRDGNQWQVSYATDSILPWQTYVNFTLPFTVARVGVYAGNTADTPGSEPAHTAIIDYFYNTASPGSGDVNLLTTNIVGNGSVVKNPDNPAYTCGQTVVLTATAASGWVFEGWQGNLTGTTNPQTLVIDGRKAVTATFKQLFSLTTAVDPIEGGSVTPASGGNYIEGATVIITATANPGWAFDGWSGGVTGSINPESLLMDSDKTITATFRPLTYTLSINTTGNGNGTIQKQPNQASYTYGQVVTLTAQPAYSSTFVGWSDGSTLMTRTITITQDQTLTATFNLVSEADEDKKVFLPIIMK